MSETATAAGRGGGAGFKPPYPVPVAPLFVWPPQLMAALQFLFGFPGLFWPFYAVFTAISVVEWFLLPPTGAQAASLDIGWIAVIYARYALEIAIICGLLYYFLYMRRTQGVEFKYNPQWPATNTRVFLFGNQVFDNVFWNLCSAAPVVTAYEVIGRWLHANGLAWTVTWSAHPIYCVALVFVLPIVAHIHFWATHLLLHWPPLYRAAHYLHHKNVNTNPWSGMAMHPIEHVIFFSSALLLYVIPCHPLHIVIFLNLIVMATAIDHNGFHRVLLPGKRGIDLDFFMHYLHHKYFEVNYAADTTFPADIWLGTFHDGTESGMAALRRRRIGTQG